MPDQLLPAVLLVVLAVPFFFWMRGIVRANDRDLVAGLAILTTISAGAVVTVRSSMVFSWIGGSVFLFGIATVVAGFFAKPSSSLSRRDRNALAGLFIVLGICLSIIV